MSSEFDSRQVHKFFWMNLVNNYEFQSCGIGRIETNKMTLTDRILGRKALEVTRNINGSFKVSRINGYETTDHVVEYLEQELDKLAGRNPGKTYRIRIR